MRRFVLFLISLFILFTISCEVGLGQAVDISVPTIGISYPPKNSVVRDSFVLAGSCDDDSGVIAVSVYLTNPENNDTYGPYDAQLSEDAKSWSILVNKKDPSKKTNEFDSFEQWEIPDGSYIASAIAYDAAKKQSQTATSPLSVDNTAPVLIVSKPLATGSDLATVYGRSLKLSGDIAEEHETSKLVVYYRQYDDSTDLFIDSEDKSIEITDSSELNAMSSSNPLILAKYDENKKDSPAHQRYLAIYGENDTNIDKYFYCGFMLEDNALVYQNPGDSGDGNGNQTNQYYLLSSDFQNVLSANYSLTAPRLMDILKGQSEDYNESQIKSISEILLKAGNYACSHISADTQTSSRETSSKFSLNPHNNPTWSLDEYGVSAINTASDIKSYSAGSSLLLSIRAGRDSSYPDPKTVKADIYDLGDFNPNTNYFALSTAQLKPISLIDPTGDSKWDESADDSEKTYTFALDTQTYELMSKHIYKMVVTGTDRNKTDLEPENDNQYMFNLSTSNNSPKISIEEPAEDFIFGKEVNENGLTVKGIVVTDAVPLKSKEDGGVKVTALTVTDMATGSACSVDLTSYDCSVISLAEKSHNKYAFEILIKAKNGSTFVPAQESKYYYTVSLKAEDMGETAPGEKNIKFYVDNKKPELKIISVTPDDGSGTVNGKIKITGIASDSGNTGSELKALSYVIKNSATGNVVEAFNNVEIALNESWSFELLTTKLSAQAAAAGNSGDSFDIIVSAVDKVNNLASVQKTIKVNQLNDQPVLELSNADKTVAAVSRLGTNVNLFPSTAGNKLYGSIKDDDGIGSLIVTSKKVGPGTSGNPVALTAAKALASGTKLYDFEYTLPSEEGQYEVNFAVKDIYALASDTDSAKKETDYDKLTHTFYVTIDDGAPVFSSIAPVVKDSAWYMGSKTGSTKNLVISGTVSDGNGFAAQNGFVVSHTADDQSNAAPVSSLAVTPQSQIAKTFVDTITLPSKTGKYKATYSAKDIYDQESVYDFEYNVDVDNPVIDGIIKIGTNNVAQNSNSIDGYITDNNIAVELSVLDNDSGIKSVSYSFDSANFTQMTPSVGTQAGGSEKWTANVSFPDGDNVAFCIRVIDNVGNYIDRTITAKVDKTKPLLEVKWYQVKGQNENEDGSMLVPSETAYVNEKNIVLYGNFSDGTDCSGINEPIFAVAGSTISPAVTYYTKSFDDDSSKVGEVINAKTIDQQGNVLDVNPYVCAYSDANSKLIRSFVAVIDKSIFAATDFPDGLLTVTTTDKAGNAINGGSLNIMRLKKDIEAPKVSGINLTKAYKTGDGKYFIRNKSDRYLTVTGTTTDNYSVDKTVLTVRGTVNGQTKEVYKKESTATGWTFNDLDLTACEGVPDGDDSITTDAVINITAFDKAGNTVSLAVIELIFDEGKPQVLTSGEHGSDPADSSNPFRETKYGFRGQSVYKYAGISVGKGTYSDASYGREASVPLTVTFVGEKLGSGVARIEYKMLSVSNVTVNTAYQSVTTGVFTGTVPADEVCTKAGTFAIETGTYKHYGSDTEIPCILGKGTISGFESSTAGIPNLVFVRAIDNCGNEGDWFALLIQVDNSNPENTGSSNPTSLLTNGKSQLQELTGTYKDEGAGLKALRLYVDGKVVLDGCLKGLTGEGTTFTVENTDSNKTLTITAKDKDGTVVEPSNYGAVNVTFTNNYAVLTYNAYYKNVGGEPVPDSFANGATYADWSLTLTPQKGSWFNELTKTAPQITLEAEDWAEDASGSGNKATVVVTSLDIDKTLPVAAITAPDPTTSLNGKQTIKGSVGENHTPRTVDIYYSTAALDANGNLPASLKLPVALNSSDASTGWKLIKSITTAAKGQNDPSDDAHIYNASVQKIYNFEIKDVNFNTFIGDAEEGKVHLLVCAQDKAGNINWADNNVTINKENSKNSYKTITVDRNSDRPLVTITSLELPHTDDLYLPLDLTSLNFKVTDDDGVEAVKYRVTKYPAESGENSWKSLSDTELAAISTNGAILKLSGEGKQQVEFQIKDKENTDWFTSTNTDSLKKIYLCDTATTPNRYGTSVSGYETPVVYVDVDTKPPVLKIKGVQYLKEENNPTEIASAAWNTSGYSSTILGGPDKQYIRVKVSATDEGSGVETVELSAKLDTVPLAENPSLTSPAADGYYYLVIPCHKDRSDTDKKDNSSYSATVTVTDKAGRQSTDSINFKVDDKLPVITIKSPASDENLSGASTIDGSISETAKIYYAISPVAVSPDTYTAQTAFSFVTYDSSYNENTAKTLPTTDKAGNPINPKQNQALKDLCKYKPYGSENSSMMSFYLWLDGKLTSTTGIHEESLNQWLKDIGITTSDDLGSPTNPFDDIVKLYFHVKAVDTAGNINEVHYPIRVDPQGNRPRVIIGYPSEEKAGGTNSLTLGGSPNIIGTASGSNPIDYVWLQVDCNADGAWTQADFTTLVQKNYELGYMKDKTLVTSIASGTDVSNYAIRVRVASQSWSQKINIGGELNPAAGEDPKPVKIWAYATDTQGFTSSVEKRNLVIDSEVPVIDQDIKLVQWAKKPNSDEYYNGGDGVNVDSNGNIVFVPGATTASRSYNEKENIKGKWFVIGKVTDESGINAISYKVNDSALVKAIKQTGEEYTVAAEGVYIRKLTKANGNSDYLFCLPIGDDNPGTVGQYTIDFTATEINDSTPRSAEMDFTVLYDNKAPEITETSVVTTIVNSDGVYTFGGVTSEDKVGTISQTGVERIAFYFTRNITGLAGNENLIFDPMIRINKTGNVLSYENLTFEDGLYWQTAGVDGVTGTEITVTAGINLPNVHIGGLAKINGVIYRIEGVNDANNKVSLSGTPGSSDSILFAIANVVDNPTREGEGVSIIRDNYGWGYYENGGYDDDDLMIESLIQEDTKYTWEASINSKNISDGPVYLHYVVFDKAENYKAADAIDCFVKNNAPRLAGIKLGTDENGNGSVDDSEINETTYHNHFANGYDGKTKKTYLMVPFNAKDDSAVSALKIKGNTKIIPEIVGGNGTVYYSYSVAKRKSDGSGWDTPYKTPVALADKKILGTGTVDDEDPDVDYTWNGPIELTVKDFLKNEIADGQNQKFSFTISDSTPSESQTATLDVIMDVALNDETAATNKIIPFYWKSAGVNSLKDNSTEKGHIELSKDLAQVTGLTLNPKISGAVKLEGIAQDNSLLEELSVAITGYKNTNEANAGDPFTIASYSEGNWDEKSGTGWSTTIDEATYADYMAAGYITELPSGVTEESKVPYVSQDYGHVVHWTMEIDTETMGLNPQTGLVITVAAKDKGKPALIGSGESATVGYTPNNFANNGDAVVNQTGGDLGNNTNADDSTAKYTCKYTMDIVPYIRGIKTKLSTKSKKSDSSEYDRTALGHYPVAKDETIYLYGFNLAGGTLYDSAATPHMASLGTATTITTYDSYKGFTLYPVSGLTSFTSGEVYVKYGTGDSAVDSLNNKNWNGTYNLKPNGKNNDTLTDDIKLDVWNVNKEAGKPSAGGRIDELTMKINPASSANGIVGFAFLDGPKDFARPKGSTNSYATADRYGGNQQDFRTTVALAYDTRGNVFSLNAGGNEGDPVNFEYVSANGNTTTKIYFEYVNQNKKRDKSGVYMDLRYKIRSPNIATSPNGNDDTNMYMVYYDSFNDEIRYKYGTVKNNGLFQKRNNNSNSWKDNNPYTCQYAQVIATDATTNLPAGDEYAYTGTPLGGAGEFVDIDVIPKGSTGGKTDEDVVVVVWYDAKAKALKYSYNDNPDNYANWPKKNGNTNKDNAYLGLNREDWVDAKTIFTDAGEYCSVKVDGKGGIHIAAYDTRFGDLRYTYLSSYNATDFTEYIVDSAGNVGSHMRMDVALDASGNPVPYISYYGSNMAKLAYPVAGNTTNGAEGDMFTGNWEVTYIPTTSEIDDLDYKRLMNIDSRINVGVWKYIDTVTGNNGHLKGQIKNSTTGTMNPGTGSGTFYGNGSANPLVSYSVLYDTANSRIETAQMQ